jgi:NTE family protein
MEIVPGGIGLALGGGGVRGLAHVLVLEALEDLGWKPSIIAGTSMGSVVGALYASGMSGREIKERIKEHTISKSDTWRTLLDKKTELLKWVEIFAPEWGRGGLIKADRFLRYLFGDIRKTRFEELEIPLLVVAANFWEASEVVFEEGELLPAIKASIAVPGVFAPVAFGDRVLVDGGVVNLVPYDHIIDRCGLTIAVDVGRTRVPGKSEVPSVLESILGTLDIMQTAALAQKMKHRKPDIYVRAEICDVGMLHFHKVEEVFNQAEPAIEMLKLQLSQLKKNFRKPSSPGD